MAMQSAHAYTSVRRESLKMQAWKDAPTDQASTNLHLKHQPTQDDWLSLSAPLDQVKKQEKIDKDSQLPPKLVEMKRAIESLIAWLSGKTIKIDIFSADDLKPKTSINIAPPPTAAAENAAEPPAEGWGAIIQAKSQYFEAESLSVAMAGQLATADGRQIAFNMSLQLNRQYFTESFVQMRAGDALKDPLVVNVGGQPAQLSANSIDFNLTPDEQMEKLPIFNPGSGYLAIDRNGNHIIDDGTELFGPQSGNGFSELQLLDEDGNGWIDEGDSSFAKLAIWQPNADGSSSLIGIGSLGIGAIFTGAIDANFDYKNTNNELKGRMQGAGMFLFEDGRTGSIQRIDINA
jgi:hypothetical protein